MPTTSTKQQVIKQVALSANGIKTQGGEMCPRCMEPTLVLGRKTLSRRYDVDICSHCGTEEALNDWVATERPEWADGSGRRS